MNPWKQQKAVNRGLLRQPHRADVCPGLLVRNEQGALPFRLETRVGCQGVSGRDCSAARREGFGNHRGKIRDGARRLGRLMKSTQAVEAASRVVGRISGMSRNGTRWYETKPTDTQHHRISSRTNPPKYLRPERPPSTAKSTVRQTQHKNIVQSEHPRHQSLFCVQRLHAHQLRDRLVLLPQLTAQPSMSLLGLLGPLLQFAMLGLAVPPLYRKVGLELEHMKGGGRFSMQVRSVGCHAK